MDIPNLRGTYDGSDRQLLAKAVKDLRNKTNAPPKNVKKLLELAKKTNPKAYKK